LNPIGTGILGAGIKKPWPFTRASPGKCIRPGIPGSPTDIQKAVRKRNL
jgi:hypothetical protein